MVGIQPGSIFLGADYDASKTTSPSAPIRAQPCSSSFSDTTLLWVKTETTDRIDMTDLADLKNGIGDIIHRFMVFLIVDNDLIHLYITCRCSNVQQCTANQGLHLETIFLTYFVFWQKQTLVIPEASSQGVVCINDSEFSISE